MGIHLFNAKHENYNGFIKSIIFTQIYFFLQSKITRIFQLQHDAILRKEENCRREIFSPRLRHTQQTSCESQSITQEHGTHFLKNKDNYIHESRA